VEETGEEEQEEENKAENKPRLNAERAQLSA
jgi:hypothetical protein